ncbi:MAG: PEP-CTERM sorting domain-containing protein [Verrucomicrobia bacterium]|nr:PEP-CTERM sorting domain-containing protein [Verrucomicrobiota bacterium]
MKTKMFLSGLMVLGLVGAASATIVVDSDWSVGQTIPDNSPAGMTVSADISSVDPGLASAGIDGVSVRLNISGGYNGDLYGYLTYNGQTVVLLNRVAGATGGTYGSSASGFGTGTLGSDNGHSESITLSDSGGTSIHMATGSPVPVGTYAPDSGGVLLNTTYSGMNPNGTWTLFLADLSTGSHGTLMSWGLDISVVPEPITWALIGFGGVAGAVALIRRRSDLSRAVKKLNEWVDAI